MKAAVLHGSGDVRIEGLETPQPGPGEVRLTVELALTGGTTLKMVRRGYHARITADSMACSRGSSGIK